MKSKRDFYNILLITCIVLILTLPFLNKAVHIDDIVFLYIAQQITKDPLHPYSFNLEWSTLTGLATHITDPALVSYYEAIIMKFFGDNEWVLHLFYILFPLTAAITMYYISKKFTKRPLFATLFLVTSIAFVVMSHNLMLDIPLLAFLLLSVAFFVYGVDENQSYKIIIGSIFCGLAYLTKYSGIVIFPILAMYALLKRRFKVVLYLTVPVVIVMLWNLYTYVIYGIPHNYQILIWLLDSQKTFALQSIIVRIITNLTYMGGATIFPFMLIYPFIKDKKSKIWYVITLSISLFLALILYFLSANFKFRYTFFQLILFMFFLSTGLFFLSVILKYYMIILSKFFLYKKNWIKFLFDNNANNIFLLVWFMAVFVFNTTFAGGAARYTTALVPPLAIMYFNIIDNAKRFNYKNLKIFIFYAFFLTIIISFAIGYADYKLADIYREFPDSVSAYENNNKIFFVGHLGFQYYMEKRDYIALKIEDNSPKKGDFVIKAKMPSPRHFSPQLKQRMELIETKSYNHEFPLRIHNGKARAGFYTYGGGFLPYSFSNASLEEFEIYRVIK